MKAFKDLSPSLAFLSQTELLRWTKGITESVASVYDKAMDAEYIKSHIGGGNHRMFDGGHDVLSAWEKVRDASPDDPFQQEVLGYVSGLWKDMSTPKGLPFMTWSKEGYDSCSEWVTTHVPGATKQWFSDLMSFDTFEILATVVGLVGAFFLLTKEDIGRLSSLLGSMGVSTIISANIFMGIAVVAVTAWAYLVKRQKLDTANVTKGASLAVISFAIFSALGLPILIELLIVIVVTKLVRDHIFDKTDLLDWAKSKLKDQLKVCACPDVKGLLARAKQKLSRIKQKKQKGIK